MKPLGRKYFHNKTGAKHHVKINGKYHAWWTDICEPNKTAARRKAKEEIASELDISIRWLEAVNERP